MSLKKWRKSASLLLVAKNAISSSQFNYKLLSLKRSTKSTTNPETTVFPGGIFEKVTDASKEWLKIFEKFKFPLEAYVNSNPVSTRPPIFVPEEVNEIPRCLSLRITAIRETFEETGILICRHQDSEPNEKFNWSNHVVLDDVSTWQRKIHKDPEEFLNLCTHFQVYPDILSLHDWSNWFTPTSVKAKFDTVFFLAALHQIPPTLAEKNEVMHLQWATPEEYKEEYSSEKMKLLLPQLYEICRLRNFTDINGLILFAQNRAPSGFEKFFPYIVSSGKETCMILPGDDLYPTTYDPTDEEVPDLTTLPESKTRHRMHISQSRIRSLDVQNYKPRFNHVPPLTT